MLSGLIDMDLASPVITAACPTSSAFLARTSGLDTTHVNAYNALICGLVADGIWTKLDVLHIYATQNTATAQLNLVSASYPATLNGGPTFTADRGYTGIDGSTTVYIDTNFNPTTAVSPNFTQNSAHLGAWLNTNTAQASPVFGAQNATVDTLVYGQYSGDMRFYFRLNCGHTLGIISPIQTANTANGLTLANRSGGADMQGYQNGSVLTFGTSTGSIASPNLNLYALGTNNSGTPNGSGYQQSMASIGSSLSSIEEALFYARLRTYMTAVGVP